jgi:hypothetical protein
MTQHPMTVSAELALTLVVPGQPRVPLVASLSYSADDPYAVRVAFHVGLDEPVEWIFARELLEHGTERREGLGDVKVWPGDGGQILSVELSSPFGQALFEAPADAVRQFLGRTYQVVPVGTEDRHVNIDAELASLPGWGG